MTSALCNLRVLPVMGHLPQLAGFSERRVRENERQGVARRNLPGNTLAHSHLELAQYGASTVKSLKAVCGAAWVRVARNIGSWVRQRIGS